MKKGGVMLKSYKYRLYPSNNQRVKLEATLDTCRHLYNDALGSRKLQAELYRLPIPKQWVTGKKLNITGILDSANLSKYYFLYFLHFFRAMRKISFQVFIYPFFRSIVSSFEKFNIRLLS